MRMTFSPASRICARSRSTCSRAPRKSPSASGLNGPYVIPLTKNFRSPSKKNFDLTPDGAIHACAFDYLESYATGAETERAIKFSEPLKIDSIMGVGGTLDWQNGRVAQQAMATIKNFRADDERTLELVEKFLHQPQLP